MSYDIETPPTRGERALRLVEQLWTIRESGNVPNDSWRGLWRDVKALVEEIRAERRAAERGAR